MACPSLKFLLCFEVPFLSGSISINFGFGIGAGVGVGAGVLDCG